MKLIAVEKKLLADLDNPMVKTPIDLLLKRHMRLIEVPDEEYTRKEWFEENHPDLTAFGLYLLLYRKAPHGMEIADFTGYSPRQNMFGCWVEMDEGDWHHMTIKTDFNIDSMFDNAIRIIMDDAGMRGHPINWAWSYGTGSRRDPGSNGPFSLAYCAGAVEVPAHLDLGLTWYPVRNVDRELSQLDVICIESINQASGANLMSGR